METLIIVVLFLVCAGLWQTNRKLRRDQWARRQQLMAAFVSTRTIERLRRSADIEEALALESQDEISSARRDEIAQGIRLLADELHVFVQGSSEEERTRMSSGTADMAWLVRKLYGGRSIDELDKIGKKVHGGYAEEFDSAL